MDFNGYNVLLQRVRGYDCDEMDEAFRRAARTFFAFSRNDTGWGDTLSSEIFWGPTGENESPFLQSEVVLPETCPLFARKFWSETVLELESWFSPCNHIGLNAECWRWQEPF
jgi:hypothetical protein